MRASGHLLNPLMGGAGGQRGLSRERHIITFRLRAGHSGCIVGNGLLERKSRCEISMAVCKGNNEHILESLDS